MELREEDIHAISSAKKEPEWMRKRRLEAYAVYNKLRMPRFGPDLSALEKQDITWFERSGTKKKSWDEVDPKIRAKFEKLGVPQSEQRFLAGLEAQLESETVYAHLKKEWEDRGVIFTNMEEAVAKHPALLRKWMGRSIPIGDNKFAALTDAVWSGGSFVWWCPKCALKAQRGRFGCSPVDSLAAFLKAEGSTSGMFGCFPSNNSAIVRTWMRGYLP